MENISVGREKNGEHQCLSRTERITLVAVKDIKDNISVCQGQPRQGQHSVCVETRIKREYIQYTEVFFATNV